MFENSDRLCDILNGVGIEHPHSYKYTHDGIVAWNFLEKMFKNIVVSDSVKKVTISFLIIENAVFIVSGTKEKTTLTPKGVRDACVKARYEGLKVVSSITHDGNELFTFSFTKSNI